MHTIGALFSDWVGWMSGLGSVILSIWGFARPQRQSEDCISGRRINLYLWFQCNFIAFLNLDLVELQNKP
jgi:hypothetical protein